MFSKQHFTSVNDALKSLKKLRLDGVILPPMIETSYNNDGDLLHAEQGVAPLAATDTLINKITKQKTKT